MKDVIVARSALPSYGTIEPVPAPELARGAAGAVALDAVRRLLRDWGLDAARFGTAAWNPLGEFIQAGARVLIKPNWVHQRNQSGQGLDCMVTHASVIAAVLEYVRLARAGSVIVGDAPVQGCDFAALSAACGLDSLGAEVRDFRGGEERDCVLFDLKERSLLEGLPGSFRVTMYDPDLLARTHAPGRHQYLVAREAIEADVVLNVPKLKCHKKACVTGALKNVVGINVNKAYLPHHRKGGADEGGDCYPGRSRLKRGVEDLLDAANCRGPGLVERALRRTAEALARGADVEGSWYGNDTVWRMVLDLHLILRYGRPDGTLADTPQRTMISITDAIVAGEGEGPLAPTPVEAGFLTGSTDAAAAEWVHARLMGFDPARIPLIRHARRGSDIRVLIDGHEVPVDKVSPLNGRPFLPPAGWAGHAEL